MRTTLLFVCTIIISQGAFGAGQDRAPVIDVHIHPYSEYRYSPEVPFNGEIVSYPRPESIEAVDQEMLQVLRRFNVVRAIVSGDTVDEVRRLRNKAPLNIVPALLVSDDTQVRMMREAARQGDLEVIGEMYFQYSGFGPDDSVYAPYFKLAEELDIPVAIHMGPGYPGVATDQPTFSVNAGDPLLLEDVVKRYPKLRIQVAHAGWPYLDRMIAIMFTYPQVYVDIGHINVLLARSGIQRYLKGLVEAGLGKRIMFASDGQHANVAEEYQVAIDSILKSAFLSEAQQRDILCFNAARFMRWDEAICE